MNAAMKNEAARLVRVNNEAGEHIITKDLVTGLEWPARHLPRQNYKSALAAIDKLNAAAFGGHGDWFIPDRTQAQTILKLDTYNPMIDSEFFPDCPSDYFWTSTVTPWSREAQFVAYFHDGYVYDHHRYSSACVRAVRVSGQ